MWLPFRIGVCYVSSRALRRNVTQPSISKVEWLPLDLLLSTTVDAVELLRALSLLLEPSIGAGSAFLRSLFESGFRREFASQFVVTRNGNVHICVLYL